MLLYVVNTGPATSYGPYTWFMLPTHFTAVAYPPQCTVTTQLVNCSHPALAGTLGASAYTVTVLADRPGLNPVQLNITTGTASVDPDLSSNKVSLSFNVESRSDLEAVLQVHALRCACLAKFVIDPCAQVNPTVVGIGNPFTLIATVTNRGPSTAFGNFVNFTLSYLENVQVQDSDLSCNITSANEGGTNRTLNVVCGIPDLALYAVRTVTVTSTVRYS